MFTSSTLTSANDMIEKLVENNLGDIQCKKEYNYISGLSSIINERLTGLKSEKLFEKMYFRKRILT